MGVIIRNGNAYGGVSVIDTEENQLLIGDSSKWAKGSKFKVFDTPYSLGITGNLVDNQNMLVFTADGVDEEGESDTQATIAVGDKAGITVMGTSKAEIVSNSSLQVAANSKLIVTSSSSGNIAGNSNLNIFNQGRLQIDTNSFLKFNDNSTAHISENTYIDIDGVKYGKLMSQQLKGHIYSEMDSLVGEVQHDPRTGPTILIHDAPFITFDSSKVGHPIFQVSGQVHFLLSDAIDGNSNLNEAIPRWNRQGTHTSPQTGKYNFRSMDSNPLSGFPTNGSILRITGSPTVDITRAPWIKVTDNSALIMEQRACLFLSDDSYIEAGGQSDVRFRDQCEFELSDTAQFKVDGAARIEIGDGSGSASQFHQIYLATQTGPIPSDKNKEIPSFIELMTASCNQNTSNMNINLGIRNGELVSLLSPLNSKIGSRLLVQGDNTMVTIGGQTGFSSELSGTTAVKIGANRNSTNLVQIETYEKSSSHIKIGSNNGAALKLFVIPDSESKTILKQSTGKKASFNMNLLGDEESDTFIKMQANKQGKITYLLEGTDVFIQHENNTHVELWDDTKIIMRGHLTGTAPWSDGKSSFGVTKDGVGMPLHRGLDWSRPISTTSNGPVSQMYDGSNFIMRGTWLYPVYDKVVTFVVSKTYSSVEDLLDNGTVSDVDAFNDAIKEAIPDYEYLKGGTLSVTGTTATVTKFNYKPIGWEEHPESQSDSPILELYERSEVRIGSARIFADENGIIINGIEISNEKLAKLLASIEE